MSRGLYLSVRASQPGQHACSGLWSAGAQLGAKSGDVARATVPSGFVPIVGTCQDVGVAGFTLQGGSGWASAYLGPASDNVLSLDAVTVGCVRPWRLRFSPRSAS
jgi:FAD/FMN-containing dehydrogenase